MTEACLKIKDSVDLFLTGSDYITAYYMNSRQRKSFKVNENMVNLIEMIDGEKTAKELGLNMLRQYNVDPNDVNRVISMLVENKIVTEIAEKNGVLNEYDRKRYDRQINYFSEFFRNEEEGIIAQKKLMDSNVFIFGAGAVGGNIAIELAMAGVQNISIFDYDYAEQSDVSRHMYFSKKNIKKSKVDALKEVLCKIDTRINIQTYQKAMKPESDIEELIQRTDFVVNTLDEPYIGYTASKISRICVKHEIPHYIAGGFDAHLSSTGEMIIPYVTPCVECYASHFKKTLANWKPQKHPVQKRYEEIGGLASSSLFSASFASIEIIKYLSGIVDMDKAYKVRGELIFNDMRLNYLDVKKNPECPICGRKGAVV